MSIADILAPISLALYLACFVAYLFDFLSARPVARRMIRPLFIYALAAHLVYLIATAVGQGHLPLATRAQALSSVVFILLIAYFIIELTTRERGVGVFVMGLGVVFQALSIYVIPDIPLPEILAARWFFVHALVNVAAYSGFFLGFLFSILYLLLRYEIKWHRLGNLFRRLPSLDALDSMSRYSIIMGFSLLTIGLVAGSITAKAIWGRFIPSDPKILTVAISWCFYFMYLLMRRVKNCPPKRCAYISVAAFLVLVFSFIVMNFITQGTHNF
jgi:ABC-type transport system involved in cytochrome c biogenesis permease subunit